MKVVFSLLFSLFLFFSSRCCVGGIVFSYFQKKSESDKKTKPLFWVIFIEIV